MDVTQRRYRLSDRQAVAALAVYFVTRLITVRLGLAFLPALLVSTPWVLPLLRNTASTNIAIGASWRADLPVLLTAGLASMFLAVVAGSVFYWAGWRFGFKLAEQAERQDSPWARMWNPQQVAKAHDWLERWGVIAVGLAASLRFFVGPVALVAGSSTMTLRKFMGAYLTGTVVWITGTLWLGVRAGDAWPWIPETIESLSEYSLRFGLIVFAVLIGLTMLSGQLNGRRKEPATPQKSSAEAASEAEPSDTGRDD